MTTYSTLCSACTKRMSVPLSVYNEHDHKELGTKVSKRPVLYHHDSLTDFQEAREQGCFICGLSWDLLGRKASLGAKLVVNLTKISDAYHLAFRLSPFGEVIDLASFSLDLVSRKSILSNLGLITQGQSVMTFLSTELIPKKLNTSADKLESDTGSGTSLDQAYLWHQNCKETHKNCRVPQRQDPGWLPTRLLDIGIEGDMKWRLHLTSQNNLSIEYMTLSYRWDPLPSITLKTTNLDEFCQGMFIKDLPQTFEDFIQVARRFSIRYIWVIVFQY
jgi:hypothetical protein